MSITSEGIRALRDLTGMGAMDVRKGVLLAERRFEGDVLKGVGYAARSGLAVYRGGGKRRDAALVREASEWTEERAADPAWSAAAALFRDEDAPAPATPGF